MSETKKISIIGVPLDIGQGERGCDVGPAALRYARLKSRLESEGHDVVDVGNVQVPPAVEVKDHEKVQAIAEACDRLMNTCLSSYEQGRLPLVLGGDHSVAMGSVKASLKQKNMGVLWVDAHGDYNTPATSPSGNVHGMPLAVLMGQGPEALLNIGGERNYLLPENVVILGVRQLDTGERAALRAAKMKVLSMRDVDELGMSAVAAEAIHALGHCDSLHISLDMDALDPRDAPGVGTPVRGGLTYREVQLLMEKLADTEKIAAIDVVEVNPMLDHQNQTAHTAVDLVLSALGQSIF